MLELIDWKSRSDRLPLVLMGARQVGKTHLLKRLGAENFRKVHYLNFEERADLKAIFAGDISPETVLREYSYVSKEELNSGQDLLIFDEVQECPRALTSLKYFAENLPSLAVCAAGSLLGLELANASFPVGKVQIIDLHPLTFKEFLHSVAGTALSEALEGQLSEDRFSDVAHAEIWRYLKLFMLAGGLPTCVQIVVDALQRNTSPLSMFEKLRETQRFLIRNYMADMAKHCGKINAMHLERVFHSIPAQALKVLDGSVGRYVFSEAIPGRSQYNRLAKVFDWLEKAGLVTRVSIIDTPTSPLRSQAKESRFKAFLFDTGILGAAVEIDPAVIMDFNFGSYKGCFAESFVVQELKAKGESLYCWQQAKADVEFVLEQRGQVVPMEVKSGSVTRAQSLRSFINRYRPENSFICSAKRATRARDRSSPHMIPLYSVAEWRKVLLY